MTRKKGAKWKYAAAGIIIFIITALCIPSSRLLLIHIFSRKPVCLVCGQGHVIHDYYEATGISRDTLGCSPETITNIFGEPERLEEEIRPDGRLRMIYIYDGFGIEFSSKDPEQPEKVIGFRLYSPDIEIRRDIHVGSTRRQIIHAYRKCPDMSKLYASVNHEKMGDSFHDLSFSNGDSDFLRFTYDENDIVTSITYYP